MNVATRLSIFVMVSASLPLPAQAARAAEQGLQEACTASTATYAYRRGDEDFQRELMRVRDVLGDQRNQADSLDVSFPGHGVRPEDIQSFSVLVDTRTCSDGARRNPSVVSRSVASPDGTTESTGPRYASISAGGTATVSVCSGANVSTTFKYRREANDRFIVTRYQQEYAAPCQFR